MEDVLLLTDENDSSACQTLGLRYDASINRQVRLFEETEAEYLYDFTFYKGGEFYIVVVRGGFLMQEYPEQPGKQRIMSSSAFPTGVMFYLKRDFVHIPLDFLEVPDLCVAHPKKRALLENPLISKICAEESEGEVQSRQSSDS